MGANGEAVDVRLLDLNAQSERDNCVLVEMVYCGKWVRFDMSEMEAGYLDLEELGRRYFGRALRALGIDRSGASESSASETLVTKE